MGETIPEPPVKPPCSLLAGLNAGMIGPATLRNWCKCGHYEKLTVQLESPQGAWECPACHALWRSANNSHA